MKQLGKPCKVYSFEDKNKCENNMSCIARCDSSKETGKSEVVFTT